MIHEIQPHKLNNVFVTGRKPAAGDIVICVKEDSLMVSELEGNVKFPTWQELPETLDYQYLFSLDKQGVFYLLQEGREPLPGFTYKTLREIRYEIGAPLQLMYMMYTAWHLICWYRDNRFCGRCGSHTRHSTRERALICDKCGNRIYPRIVPAVIAGVIWEDKILLTKYANRKMSFYALIAGFTEIGETLEECVAREVMEETGLKVKNIRYYKSQPWGSVQDLIMGFYCDVDGDTHIHIDKSELKEGVWVSRAEIEGQRDDWSLTNQMMMTFKAGKEPH
jgi:NAD+ diphosphatase